MTQRLALLAQISGIPLSLLCGHKFYFRGWEIGIQKTIGIKRFYWVI